MVHWAISKVMKFNVPTKRCCNDVGVSALTLQSEGPRFDFGLRGTFLGLTGAGLAEPKQR